MALVQAGTAGFGASAARHLLMGNACWEPPHHVPAWATGPGRVLPAAAHRVRAVPRSAGRCRRLTRGVRAPHHVPGGAAAAPPHVTAPAPRASFAGAQRVGRAG